MSNYNKATNFTVKDSLNPGDPNKKVRGTEIDEELSAIQTAVNSKADASNPTFSGDLTCDALTSNGIDDNATTHRLRISNSIMAVGEDNVTGYNIYRNRNDSFLRVGGGSSTTAGAQLEMYGGAHASNANDINFKADNTSQLHYQDSTDTWFFQNNEVRINQRLTTRGFVDNASAKQLELIDNGARIGRTGVPGFVLAADNTQYLRLSGDPATGAGGEVILFGGSHASQARDISFSSGGVIRTLWDDSVDRWVWHVHARYADNANVYFGNSDNFAIQHAGGNTFLNNNTGALYIDSEGAHIFRNGLNNQRVTFDVNGNVNVISGDVNAVDFNATSDVRKKKNLKAIPKATDKLKRISGYSYQWKHNNVPTYGCVAQEVETILPNAVVEKEATLHLKYNAVVALLVEAVKDLTLKVEKLESHI